MGVDATVRAKVVLGGVRVELVELKVLSALDDADTAQWHRGNYRALASANGTIAAPRIDDAIRQIQLQLNRPAVTCGSMLWTYLHSTHFFEHCGSLL